MNSASFASVALPLPLAEPYLYKIPTSLADRALPGARVVVPVRDRQLIGVIVSVGRTGPTVRAKELLALPDEAAIVPLNLLQLAGDAARHLGCPMGLMLRAMLPSALWGKSEVQIELIGRMPRRIGGRAGELVDWLRRNGGSGSVSKAARSLRFQPWGVVDRLQRIGVIAVRTVAPDTRGAVATRRVATLTGEPLSLLERDERFARAPAQRRIYQALEEAGGTLSVKSLLEQASASPAPLKSLVDVNLIVIEEEVAPRDPFGGLPSTPPPKRLTTDQANALNKLSELPEGDSALVFGVTGSGKTAVYLERIRQLLELGRGAIMLVPEIALTPQTVARLRGAFGDQVAVLHSALSPGERADAWRQLQSGERRVAVGARSAVFAPVRELGVIVLDEEHESSYKNGETPRYHAREIAQLRAKIEAATVVLGSATPSPESWVRANSGGVRIDLPSRIGGLPMPPVELVDLRVEPSLNDGALPWTRPLETAMTATLSRGEQALLLLNRRGWASFVQCRDCGSAVECPECSITLTVHRKPDQLRCHYCDFRQPHPEKCPTCSGTASEHRGAGTQQLERLVSERFPGARIARMDLDTTGSRWAHHRILEKVTNGEVDVLLGTQMIAKGIDIPNVTMVGVIDADHSLHLPDFRAAEKTFQLVAQVAGRAGRGPKGGRVIVQSRQTEHPALVAAANHDAIGFLEQELEIRRSPVYPPHVELARVVASGDDQDELMRWMTEFAGWSETAIAKSGSALIVLGPAPCPIERIRGQWRVHLLVKGSAAAVASWVRTVGPRLGSDSGPGRVSLDHRPLSLL